MQRAPPSGFIDQWTGAASQQRAGAQGAGAAQQTQQGGGSNEAAVRAQSVADELWEKGDLAARLAPFLKVG